MMGSMMTNIIGSCSNSDNPDMWHPEVPRGNLGVKGRQELRSSMLAAIAICKSCPVQKECLAEGMLDENLPWGIWGGKLAGERASDEKLRRPSPATKGVVCIKR